MNYFSILLVKAIRFYQIAISPFSPSNACRYYPTCSEYYIQAINKYGLLKGSKLGVSRLLSCHSKSNRPHNDPLP